MQDIVDLINSPSIKPRYRIYLLNSDETINSEVPQEDIIEGGTLSENYQNGQRRSLTFTLMNEHGKYTPGINSLWAGSRVRVDIGLTSLNGDII